MRSIRRDAPIPTRSSPAEAVAASCNASRPAHGSEMNTAIAGVDALGEQIAAAPVVVPVGSRTHWEVGGAAPSGEQVRAPAGVIAYDPAELTVTVGAGTTVAELADALAVGKQECVLDPRDPQATVGGVLASGLTGHRRLRHGPLRDRLLEVRFVTGEGRVVKGGGPTVKNVT